jgi:hypothetical protein
MVILYAFFGLCYCGLGWRWLCPTRSGSAALAIYCAAVMVPGLADGNNDGPDA